MKNNNEGLILFSLMFPPLLLVFYRNRVKKNVLVFWIVILTIVCMIIELYLGIYISISYALHGATILTLLLAEVFFNEFKSNIKNYRIEVTFRIVMSVVFAIGAICFYLYTKEEIRLAESLLFYAGLVAISLRAILVLIEGGGIIKRREKG